LGEAITVVVTLKDYEDTNEKAILEHCKKLMPHYMLPKRILITDKFPVTSSGKLDRPAIASNYGDKIGS